MAARDRQPVHVPRKGWCAVRVLGSGQEIAHRSPATGVAGHSRTATATGSRSRLDALSPYQLRVLQLMAQGLSNVAIADQLGVSRRAIENQVSRLMQALGLARNDDAVAARVCAVLIYLAESAQSPAASR